MDSEIIYEERVVAKGFIIIFLPIIALMLILMIYQVVEEPFEGGSFLTWFYFIMFILFFGMMLNFRNLTIRLTSNTITVSFGFIKRKIHLENVENCYLDDVSAVKYGGFGIRIAKIKGKKRLVYNTIGTKRCVLVLKKGKFQEFVFSSKNPEEVINVIKGQLSLVEKLK